MAVVAVVFDGTRLSASESETDGGVWDKYKATQSPTQETDFILQGTNEISNKVSNSAGGLEFEDDATVDFTTPKVVLVKFQCSTPGLLDLTVAKALSYEVGQGTNGGTWSYEYYLSGLYAGAYPLLKNWRVIAIDPNEVAWRDAETGTPAISTTDWYGLYADITSVVKSENLIHSALDHVNSGAGLTLTGGDGASADGTLDDFLAEDFDNSSNRWGVIIPGEDENIINGVLTIGTATATVYNDSNRFLVFPHHLVGDGFCGVDIGMSNASSDINFTSYTFKGKGNASVILGDARTSLEQELIQEKARNFDVLFVDAFSGDSIPIHLLTKEAFEIYFKHIKDDGALVVHITNLHIDLSDPVRQLAKRFGREAMLVDYDPSEDPDVYHLYFSEWVIVTKNQETIRNLYGGDFVTDWRLEEPKEIHWTDDYSNLLEVIMHND